MNENATFNEADWAELSASDKRALKICARVFAITYESLAKAPHMGQKSADSLIAQGLLIEGEKNRHNDRTFKLTGKGKLASDWVHGIKNRNYPRQLP